MARSSVKNRIIILAIASMVPCAVAHAAKTITIATNTAGELADTCGVKPGDPGAGTKQTFCQGFAQGAISVELHHAGRNKPFCFPRPAPSRAETMKQFADWVGAMPERRSLSSTDGLLRFLSGRYPCKAKQPVSNSGGETSKAAEPAK
jgi:Ssp1 endopeptidase immunity protein Rap1a